MASAMETPRNLLFLAHSGNQGGAELCLDTTLRCLDRSRYRASVVFPWEGKMVDSARVMGLDVEIHHLAAWMLYERCLWQYKNAFLTGWARVRHLVRRIRREKIDLVYSNTAVIYEGALAARLAGVPHVWHVHEVLTPEHMTPRMFPFEWMVRRIGRWSDRVLFESQAARQIVAARIPAEKSRVIHNSARFLPSAEGDKLPAPAGTDEAAAGSKTGNTPDRRQTAALPKGQPGNAADRRRPDPLPKGEAGKGPVIAWIGRFSERKNPRLLLQALRQVRHLDGATILMVGDGPLKPAIREEIERTGLSSLCHVLPFQDDIRPVLQAADLLVLTSREESFGLVLVEAGAWGKPVVATRSQGPAEIVLEGQTGFLVDQDDVPALAARIDQLLSDPQLRGRMGEAAARHIAAEFSPVTNTRKLEAVFEELLNRTV
jgi:glycosyltransferase involved in cell wall biosynthesis